jgi:hypothetical protein
MQVVSKTRLVKFASRVALAGLASLSGVALSKDKDGSEDPSAKSDSTLPNLYLDLRTNYATVPANALSIGFSSPSLSTAIATLQSLSSLTNGPTLPGRPTLSSPSSRNVALDAPLTVDVSDRVSLYGGFTASVSQSGMSDWVDAGGLHLVRRISGRRLSAESRIDPDDHAAIDGDANRAGFPARHDVAQQRCRV